MDFGDDSVIENPKLLNEKNFSLNHIYKSNGLFNTNLTVFNKVSSFSYYIKVTNFNSTKKYNLQK